MIEGEPVHIHPRAAIVVPADRVLALDAGQVEVRADARLLEVADAERWLNLAADLVSRPRVLPVVHGPADARGRGAAGGGAAAGAGRDR